MSTTLTIYSQVHLWISLPLPQFLVLWFSRQAHVDAGDFNVISCFNSSMCSYKNMYTELGILRSSIPTSLAVFMSSPGIDIGSLAPWPELR